MRRLYQALDLPDFAHVELVLQNYISSLGGYRRNRFHGLNSELQRRIVQEWQPWFEAWGYSTALA
jgi:hypothetical protein